MASLLASTVAVIVTLASSAPALGAETVIGFDDLESGTPVTTQYAAQGLKMGFASSLGQSSPGKGDCGSPTVSSDPTVTPSSSPNYALLPSCPDGFRGTFGAISGTPRGSLSVQVRRSMVIGVPAFEAQVIAYDGSGKEVGSGHGQVDESSWHTIAVSLTGSGKISYFLIRSATTLPGGAQIAIDNLRFEAEPSESKPEPEPKPTPEPKPEPPPPPRPPVASLALLTPSPQPGGTISVTGAGSQPGAGQIISYDWDLNGDGKIDTSTKTNPVVDLIFKPGPHTIGLTITNSNGETSTSHLGVNVPSHISLLPPPDGGQGECKSSLDEGNIHILAECIQADPGGGFVISTKRLAFNGMVLAPAGGGFGVFHIKVVKELGIGDRTKLSGPPVNVELLNTPIGDVVLGGIDLEHEPITLAFHAFKPPTFKGVLSSAGQPVASSAGSSKTLVMAFAVAHKCGSGSKKSGCCPPQNNTSCATLPGEFPLTGQVAVYLDDKGQLLVDVQVGLELSAVNFQATGALEMVVEKETGISLTSLKFAIPEASLAEVFKVADASFTYYFPSDPEASKRDSWQAKATITFGPLEQPGMEGELSFKKGEFHSASMVFTAPSGAGVPIYPGVELNKIGASVGVNPLAFGGVLGASIATQLELTLEFKFREATSEELGFFGGQGKLSYKGDDIATLAADVYSDGYIDAKLDIDLHFPFGSKEPPLEVGGSIGFWDESASGLWQAEGNAHIKIWVISAEAAVLVNNLYAAGCLAAGEFGVQGRYRFSDGNIDGGFFGLKKCSDELKQYKQTPLVKHSGGFVKEESSLRVIAGTGAPASPFQAPGRDLATGARAQSASSQAGVAAGENGGFRLPAGTAGQELRVTSGSGTPAVRLTSPGGQTFTTPLAAGQVVTSGDAFIAAIAPDPHQVIVFLRKPAGGEWHVEALPGSAPIGGLETAEDVAPATVTARVRHRRGKSWTLAYRIAHFVPGTHVRFLERGHDTTHLIGVAGGAHGAFKFTPQEGLARPRTVIAYLLNHEGMPKRSLMVAHFRAAPPTRGGRVGRVRFVRRGASGLITWGAAKAARAYRIKVRGGDGRVQTFFRKASRRSVSLTGLLPFDGYTATIVAEGGPNLLSGPAVKAKLAPVKPKTPKRRRQRNGRKG